MSLRGNIQHGQRRRVPYRFTLPLTALGLGLIVLSLLIVHLSAGESVLQIAS